MFSIKIYNVITVATMLKEIQLINDVTDIWILNSPWSAYNLLYIASDRVRLMLSLAMITMNLASLESTGKIFFV